MKILAATIASAVLFVASAPAPAARAPEEKPRAFVGTKRCRVCHAPEHASWAETKMAKAFELLKPGVARTEKTKAKLDPEKDFTRDPSCLACHTTGYGKPGGFTSLAATPDLAGVGCESCHGAGADYVGPMRNKTYRKSALVALGLVDTITKEQCASCHNPDCPVGVVIGSRHFKKELNFERGRIEGTHEKFPLKNKH